MPEFKTFVGLLADINAKNGTGPIRSCEDVVCRNFKEARAKALALYKEKRGSVEGLKALVVCEDSGLLIASGLRPGSVQNFGNGYCVDVTPSCSMPLPPAENFAPAQAQA